MNKKQTITYAMFALVFGVALSPIISAENVEARPDNSRHEIRGDLTIPNGDKPFGGANAGTYSILVKDDIISIYADLNLRASSEMVFEGWLVDVETGEKQSTGKFKEDRTRGFFYALPAFHYDVFVVTTEPVIDSDPAPNKPVAGVPLGFPFGQ